MDIIYPTSASPPTYGHEDFLEYSQDKNALVQIETI